ncbi:MAG TPA: TfoX/Sxy family protein [Jatrophihabitans sp.]|nr:TfoX/Sxy family protein [Jatrophihabitans sp.]
MAYDVELANRLRAALAGEQHVSEKAMFGGLAFLIDGAMAVAVSGQGGLLLRVDPNETDALLRRRGVHRFVMHGRELAGWLRIEDAAMRTDAQLAGWVRRGVAQARLAPARRR